MKCVKNGGNCPVAAAVRGRLPESQPLGQLDQCVPDPIVMLGANPPDDLVVVSVVVNVFGRQFGFTYSSHADYDLYMRSLLAIKAVTHQL